MLILLYKNKGEREEYNRFPPTLAGGKTTLFSYVYHDFKNRVDTSNFSFSLPAHNLNVIWYNKDKLTADILTEKQYKDFIEFINL